MFKRSYLIIALAAAFSIACLSTSDAEENARTIQKRAIALAVAKKMAFAVEEEATRRGVAVVIVVVDNAGHLTFAERMDGALLASIDIALGKARTAVGLEMPTGLLEDAVNNGLFSIMTSEQLTALRGGIPIHLDGFLVGAIAVSGAPTGELDDEMARVGLATLEQ